MTTATVTPGMTTAVMVSVDTVIAGMAIAGIRQCDTMTVAGTAA